MSYLSNFDVSSDEGSVTSDYSVDVDVDYIYRDNEDEGTEFLNQVGSDNEEAKQEDDAAERILIICQAAGVPHSFPSREEAEYKIRLSQCLVKRSFKVSKNDKSQYIIRCCHPSCIFYLCTRETSRHGVTITDGMGIHTCSVNDHVVGRYKSPASHAKFLARYLRDHICSNTTSNKELIEKVNQELGCVVTPSTMNRVLNIATNTYLHNHTEGYKLLTAYGALVIERGGYSHLETELLPVQNITVTDSHGNVHEERDSPRTERFLRMFVTLKEQRHYASFIEYVSIDATHLPGKFGGMLFCAATLNPNKNLVILGQAIMPTENYENWLYFLRHFQIAGLGSKVTFIMSDLDKGLIAAAKQVFPMIPHSKCLRHLSENFKKLFATLITNTTGSCLNNLVMLKFIVHLGTTRYKQSCQNGS